VSSFTKITPLFCFLWLIYNAEKGTLVSYIIGMVIGFTLPCLYLAICNAFDDYRYARRERAQRAKILGLLRKP
jgi:hypothetical protein